MSPKPENETESANRGIINVTRRQALKMGMAATAANAAVSKPNIENVLAATEFTTDSIGDIHFQVQASPNGGYGQFENPDTGEYVVFGGTEIMKLEGFNTNIDDETLTAYIYMSMDGSDFYEIGSVSKPISDFSNPDTWAVSAADLWENNTDAWVSEDGGADLKELAKDTGLPFNDYNDIALDSVPTDLSDPMSTESTITFKYIFQTETLEINEQKEKSFDIVTSVVLGFGKSFGKNFGMKDLDHSVDIEARIDPS